MLSEGQKGKKAAGCFCFETSFLLLILFPRGVPWKGGMCACFLPMKAHTLTWAHDADSVTEHQKGQWGLDRTLTWLDGDKTSSLLRSDLEL